MKGINYIILNNIILAMIEWYSQHSGWLKKIPAAWPWISQVARLVVAADPGVIPGSPPGASSCVARIDMRTKHLRTFCVAIAYSCPDTNSQPCLDSQRAQLWRPDTQIMAHIATNRCEHSVQSAISEGQPFTCDEPLADHLRRRVLWSSLNYVLMTCLEIHRREKELPYNANGLTF